MTVWMEDRFPFIINISKLQKKILEKIHVKVIYAHFYHFL